MAASRSIEPQKGLDQSEETSASSKDLSLPLQTIIVQSQFFRPPPLKLGQVLQDGSIVIPANLKSLHYLPSVVNTLRDEALEKKEEFKVCQERNRELSRVAKESLSLRATPWRSSLGGGGRRGGGSINSQALMGGLQRLISFASSGDEGLVEMLHGESIMFSNSGGCIKLERDGNLVLPVDFKSERD